MEMMNVTWSDFICQTETLVLVLMFYSVSLLHSEVELSFITGFTHWEYKWLVIVGHGLDVCTEHGWMLQEVLSEWLDKDV